MAGIPSEALADRIAGAPISWGLCEVPGWGYQLTPERVLGEMQDLGLVATEFGPELGPVRPGEELAPTGTGSGFRITR